MTPDELFEYNKIAIEVAHEIAKPWKWATFILSVLLIGMLLLYFSNPVEIDFDANGNNNSEILQKG